MRSESPGWNSAIVLGATRVRRHPIGARTTRRDGMTTGAPDVRARRHGSGDVRVRVGRLRRILLVTHDPRLYIKSGFTPLEAAETYMEIHDSDVYASAAAAPKPAG
jgi:hypothetical protein